VKRARVVVVVAHPDDETIAFGARLGRWQPRAVVVLTNGAPHDPWFARQAGFACRDHYARARLRELRSALAVAEIDAERLLALDIPDQDAVLHLSPLIARVAEVLRQTGATLVATHAYEGGHPDHDAAAVVVAAASASLPSPPRIVEAALYHDAFVETVYGHFIPHARAGAVRALHATAEDLDRKRRMLACYATQREVWSRFDPKVERLRVAPPYDFALAPHAGRLHYERWGWPLDGGEFRAHVADALHRGGLRQDLLERRLLAFLQQ
jgi:LmbE family N-acetylglucosaminyl deacetylase